MGKIRKLKRYYERNGSFPIRPRGYVGSGGKNRRSMCSWNSYWRLRRHLKRKK